MIENKNIFLEKKILIYGLGKSGIASYKFLNNKAKVYLFDDNEKKNIKLKSNLRLNTLKEISKIKYFFFHYHQTNIDLLYFSKIYMMRLHFYLNHKLIFFFPKKYFYCLSLS